MASPALRAFILAAGRGERMRPLTDTTPKPLLRAGGKPLIGWQLERLAAAGIRDIVVNHSHLGARLEAEVGDGSGWGVRIAWSREATALETAGGIANALPLLGERPFVVVSGDIYTDFDFARLEDVAARIQEDPGRRAAHFVLVDNPPFHPAGDMGLADGRVRRDGPLLTYANIGVFHPALFADIGPGARLRLFPWAYRFVEEGRVTGERFGGAWENLGTPRQLEALDRRLSP
ncbi:MAG TPA: nucleotidyltransferase family protein [Usitatibacteraceae bacterium]|nr:nucleotidyltransferase family protein [Usitatibacteraceae bacterium]